MTTSEWKGVEKYTNICMYVLLLHYRERGQILPLKCSQLFEMMLCPIQRKRFLFFASLLLAGGETQIHHFNVIVSTILQP